MKTIAILALLGAISPAEAMRLSSKTTSTVSQETLQGCEARLETLKLFRFCARQGVSACSVLKQKYEAWQPTEASSLAQTKSKTHARATTTYDINLQNCLKTEIDLKNYADGIKSGTSPGDHWAWPMNYYWTADVNQGWANWMKTQSHIWNDANPIHTNDGDVEEEKKQEEEKQQVPDNSDDKLGVDSHLPWWTQKNYPNDQCDTAYNRIMDENNNRIKTEGTLFIDHSFPQTQESYGGSSSNAQDWNSPIRFDQYFPTLINDSSGSNSINQGGLGDCWLLAAISALAEKPERITKILNNRTQYAGDGKFVADMWLGGMAARVTMDDAVPGSGGDERFSVFSARQAPDDSWFAPILEKAMAKMMGSYQNLEGGNEPEAYWAFTGYPSESINHSSISEDSLWSLLNQWESKEYPTSAANQSPNFGLVAGHAYTVLGPRTYNGEKLIELRNPWGSEMYNGPWSDKESPSKWTADAKEKLSHTTANDGTFFMRFSDYKNTFYRTDANLYDETWKSNKLSTSWDRNSSTLRNKVYTIVNPTAQRVVIGMSAPNPRMFKRYTCIADERPERFLFYLTKEGSSSWLRDSRNKQYNFFRAQGKDFFVFDNLAAGTYHVRFNGQVSAKTESTGSMPFYVHSWGGSQALPISE